MADSNSDPEAARPSPTAPIRIVRGLNVPISGEPEQTIGDAAPARRAALLGADYPGLKPAMRVEEGDRVRLGQPLFADRRDERILFTAPGAGRVAAIHRGPRRSLVAVVIALEGEEAETFPSWSSDELAGLDREQVTETLLRSGLWTAFRTRPFGRRADPDRMPAAIFVTAIDTHPLAARAEVVVAENPEAFADGLTVLSHLTDGAVHVCQRPRAGLPIGVGANIRETGFAGPHPAGLAGTHIHFLDSAGSGRTVWYLDCRDVMAIGRLFTTGRLPVDRVIALAGPPVTRPRLIRARLGADIGDLVAGELDDTPARVISGSLLSGRRALGDAAFLGRYHNQISVVGEASSGGSTFTTYDLTVSRRPPRRRFALSTIWGGRTDPMVPYGGYERVNPLDILPTPLVRALLVGDSEMAEALGCLELDEEDVALWSAVCPSGIDHAGLLRQMLDHIEEGG